VPGSHRTSLDWLLPGPEAQGHPAPYTTVSQTLRYLRASEAVAAERDGRIIRYRLASQQRSNRSAPWP
jgi:hypothetical protein